MENITKSVASFMHEDFQPTDQISNLASGRILKVIAEGVPKRDGSALAGLCFKVLLRIFSGVNSMNKFKITTVAFVFLISIGFGADAGLLDQRDPFEKTIMAKEGWLFALDHNKIGEAESWFSPRFDGSHWHAVSLGKPWNHYTSVSGAGKFMGAAWFRRLITIPEKWQGRDVFVGPWSEYRIWINGVELEDSGPKATELLKYGQENLFAIRIENNKPGNKGIGDAFALSLFEREVFSRNTYFSRL